MILPIYALGYPVLTKKAAPITSDYENLAKLIENMFETMYAAQGVGLAGPQIGKSIRIFVVDTVQTMDEGKEHLGIKKVFINPQTLALGGKPYDYEEGCLSIPGIRGEVSRPEQIRLKYFDENFVEHDEIFDGVNSRVIQHEYDHLEGILFTELLKPIKKRMIKRKLVKVKEGKIGADYRIKYFKAR